MLQLHALVEYESIELAEKTVSIATYFVKHRSSQTLEPKGSLALFMLPTRAWCLAQPKSQRDSK
jgi:hypothetical protein